MKNKMKKFKFGILILAAGILMMVGFSNGIVFAAQNASQYGSQDNGQAVRVKPVSLPKPVKESASRSLAARASSVTDVAISFPWLTDITNDSVKQMDFDGAGNPLESTHYLVTIDGSIIIRSTNFNIDNLKNYYYQVFGKKAPNNSLIFKSLKDLSPQSVEGEDHTFFFKIPDIPINRISKKENLLVMKLVDGSSGVMEDILEQKFNLLLKLPDAAYQPQIYQDRTTVTRLSEKEIEVKAFVRNLKRPNNYVVPAKIVSEVLDKEGNVIAGTTKSITINDSLSSPGATLTYGKDKLKNAVSMRLTVVRQGSGAVLGSPVTIALVKSKS